MEGKETEHGQRGRGRGVGSFLNVDVEAVKERLHEGAAEVVERVKRDGEKLINDGKNRAAVELGNVGQAARRAAEKLQDQNSGPMAGVVEGAAEKLERAAKYIEQKKVEELVKDVEGLARRRPALFLGGLFVVGMAAARLTKAAAAGTEGALARRRDE
jgi:hypothetical protein